MKIAYKIAPVTNNISDLHLLIEAGAEEISFLLFYKNPLSIEGYYSYNLNKDISAVDYVTALKNIIAESDVLKQTFASTNIFYNFNTATLVPTAYFVEEEKSNICNTMFGQDKTAYCFQENVNGQHIKLIYRVPEKIYETFNNLYPKNIFAHSTSEQISFTPNNSNTLRCIVYHRKIKLLLYKDDQFQLVQYFNYETAADVIYHLLNVCARFKITPTNIQLVLAGIIETNDNLNAEIYKYFLNVSFAAEFSDVNIAEPLQTLPSHIFQHLTALAKCV